MDANHRKDAYFVFILQYYFRHSIKKSFLFFKLQNIQFFFQALYTPSQPCATHVCSLQSSPLDLQGTSTLFSQFLCVFRQNDVVHVLCKKSFIRSLILWFFSHTKVTQIHFTPTVHSCLVCYIWYLVCHIWCETSFFINDNYFCSCN